MYFIFWMFIIIGFLDGFLQLLIISKGVKIGKCFFDFLIEDKIILEIKKDNNFSRKHIEQVHSYLKTAGLKLGIIANFTKEGIKYKRILNEK